MNPLSQSAQSFARLASRVSPRPLTNCTPKMVSVNAGVREKITNGPGLRPGRQLDVDALQDLAVLSLQRGESLHRVVCVRAAEWASNCAAPSWPRSAFRAASIRRVSSSCAANASAAAA